MTAGRLLGDMERPASSSPIAPPGSGRLDETTPTPASVVGSANHYGLPPVLSVPQAAAFAGVSRKAIYRAIASGDLPACRSAKPFRILRERLLAWLGGETPSRNTDSVARVVTSPRQGRVVRCSRSRR